MPPPIVMPPLPRAPRMPIAAPWQPSMSVDQAIAQSETPPKPPITFSGSPDWAAERAGFLSGGSDPRIAALADAGDVDREIEDNATSGRRPDLLEQMQVRYALEGLRNARTREGLQNRMLDPGYRRQQAEQDAVSQAQTYMDPTVAKARGAGIENNVAQQRALEELRLMLGMDPRAQQLGAQDFSRKKELTEIGAEGRNPFAAMMQRGPGGGPGGGVPGATPPRGAGGGLTADAIRQRVLTMGGSEEDVQATIADAQARGMLAR